MTDSPADDAAIAIVGMAGRFPACRSVDELWRLLRDGREATRWLTESELIAAGERAEALADADYVRASLVLPDMEMFDEAFFGFTPREAAILDPQHRHFLECCWEAFEDAAHVPDRFDGAIGVFAGCGMQSYFARNLLTNPELVERLGMFLIRHTGNDKDFLTTRASYLFDLRGPSIGVQTACSTSLVAVHMAVQSLLSGECDMALAGGVSIEVPHGRGYRYAEGEILSSNGHCRAFADDADGTLFGSGAGIVVLRRLAEAVRDGDNIHAVIRGTAVSNDGALKAGYFAPSVEGQVRAVAEAIAVSGVDPSTVDYIEAHGTGTLVGDPIELTALQQAYQGAARGTVGIGSIKSNIGHLDTAAGVASLIKAATALEREALPASVNVATPNTRFDWAASPFRVAAETRPWPRGERPRRAGVNSLGVGGTNAHVILEEAPARPLAPAPASPQLVLLSAKSPRALGALADKWAKFLEDPAASLTLADAAYATQVGRKAFSHRASVCARDLAGLRRGVAAAARRARKAADEPPRVVFMFPGGGVQYPGAGRELYQSAPAFRAAVDACFADMPAGAPGDLRALMLERAPDDADAAAKLEQPLRSILAVFVLEHALAKLWESWGVRPAAVIGHSAGEYAAAVTAGVMSLRDALATVALRGEIFEALPPGGMLVVKTGEERARQACAGLDIAAVNAPELLVASGPAERLDAAAAMLADQGVETSRVRIKVAAHSRMLDADLPRFREHMQGLALEDAAIPFVSNLSGAPAEPGELASADYWTRHLRETVRFGDGLAAALAEPGAVLLEVGPGQTLSALAEACAAAHAPADVVASMPGASDAKEGAGELSFALDAAGRLWSCGAEIDFAVLRGEGPRRRVSLPTYAFEKNRHWIEPGRGAEAPAPPPSVALERLASFDDWFLKRTFEPAPLRSASPDPTARWLVFTEQSDVSAAVLAALRARGAPVTTVEPGAAFAELAADRFALEPTQAEDYERLLGALEAKGARPTVVLHAWSLAAATERAGAADAGRALGFDSLLALARALQLRGWDDALHLAATTTGAISVAGERGAHPELAAAIGPCRVLPRESPGVSAQVIDLDPAASPEESARAVLAEIDARAPDAVVALRRGERLVETLAPAPVGVDSGPARLRERGVYVITGGLGGVGLALARHLAETVRARIALLARSAPSEAARARFAQGYGAPEEVERARALQAIRAAGGEVLVVEADVADQAATARALGEVRRRFGTIHGVFHAAGRMDDAPMAMKTRESVDAVLAPKVAGSFVLDALLPEGSVDLFAGFASTSLALGPPGQADYVAANAVLDAVTTRRRDGLSILWGAWADVGMAARAVEESRALAAADHPLLGAREDVSSDTVVFWTTVDSDASWVAAEHVIGGRAVLPGAAWLEMAIAAAERTGWGARFALRDLVYVAPLVFDPPGPRRVRVSVTRIDARESRIEIESRARPSEAWSLHAQAVLTAGEDEPCLRAPSADELADVEADRLAMGERGIAFGPRWRCLEKAARGREWVIGEARLGDEHASDLSAYVAHPALLDVASSIGLFLLEDVGRDGQVYAPTAVDRIERFARLPARVSAVARRVHALRGQTASFDVDVADGEGRTCIALRGLAFRRIAPAEGAPDPGPRAAQDDPIALLVAHGLTAEDAPALFTRVLASQERSIVASSLSIARLRAFYAALRARRTDPPMERAGPAEGGEDGLEAQIVRMCAEIIGDDGVGPDTEFLSFGGGSLAGVRLFARIRRELGVDLALSALFEAPTPRLLAEVVAGSLPSRPAPAGARAPAGPAAAWSPLVRMRAGEAGRRPLFCVHGAGGNVVTYKAVVDRLAPETPIYGLQAQGVDGKRPFHGSVEEMAQCYLAAIRAVAPRGPYQLLGYSGGGVIAYEMAQRLKRDGEEVSLLGMIDTLAPHHVATAISLKARLHLLPKADPHFLLAWPQRTLRRRMAIRRVKQARSGANPEAVSRIELLGDRAWNAFWNAQLKYVAEPYDGDILLFRAKYASLRYVSAGPTLGWSDLARGRVDVVDIAAWHDTVFEGPSIDVVAGEIGRRVAGESR